MRYNFSLFGPRLREACKARSMTVNQLGGSVGLAPERIIDLETGGLRSMDIERLSQIADYLGVSVDWLLGATERSCP